MRVKSLRNLLQNYVSKSCFWQFSNNSTGCLQKNTVETGQIRRLIKSMHFRLQKFGSIFQAIIYLLLFICMVVPLMPDQLNIKIEQKIIEPLIWIDTTAL